VSVDGLTAARTIAFFNELMTLLTLAVGYMEVRGVLGSKSRVHQRLLVTHRCWCRWLLRGWCRSLRGGRSRWGGFVDTLHHFLLGRLVNVPTHVIPRRKHLGALLDGDSRVLNKERGGHLV
jgi:hypothetical protein